MSQFMLLFHMDAQAMASMPTPTPEQMEAMLADWMQWIGSIAEKGRFVATHELMPTGKVLSQGGSLVTDGPYIELKEMLGGYLILEADSIEEAESMAQGCPTFSYGGKVEIRQIVLR